MSDWQIENLIIAFGGLLVGFLAGWVIWPEIELRRWQRELIRRNLALYDPITGKWRWREDLDVATHQEKSNDQE